MPFNNNGGLQHAVFEGERRDGRAGGAARAREANRHARQPAYRDGGMREEWPIATKIALVAGVFFAVVGFIGSEGPFLDRLEIAFFGVVFGGIVWWFAFLIFGDR